MYPDPLPNKKKKGKKERKKIAILSSVKLGLACFLFFIVRFEKVIFKNAVKHLRESQFNI
jgi:hypothetical protein